MIRYSEEFHSEAAIPVWSVRDGGSESQQALCTWLMEMCPEIDRALTGYGGLLIRGATALRDANTFQSAVEAAGSELMDYVGGTSPRKVVAGKIMTATEVPGNYSIPLHQEMSYTDESPARIAFFCQAPAAEGGQTTFGNMRRITPRIDPGLRARFSARGGLQLQRNLPLPEDTATRPGVPKPWTEVFDTADRGKAVETARARGWAIEWLGDGSMNLRQRIRPATIKLSGTNEEIWFNQVHIFAPSAALKWARQDGRHEFADRLEGALRTSPHLVDRFIFGDGSEIPEEDALYLYDLLRREAVPLGWQSGDLLLLDNVRAAHGRTQYSGSRTILTALIGRQTATRPTRDEHVAQEAL